MFFFFWSVIVNNLFLGPSLRCGLRAQEENEQSCFLPVFKVSWPWPVLSSEQLQSQGRHKEETGRMDASPTALRVCSGCPGSWLCSLADLCRYSSEHSGSVFFFFLPLSFSKKVTSKILIRIEDFIFTFLYFFPFSHLTKKKIPFLKTPLLLLCKTKNGNTLL